MFATFFTDFLCPWIMYVCFEVRFKHFRYKTSEDIRSQYSFVIILGIWYGLKLSNLSYEFICEQFNWVSNTNYLYMFIVY